MNKKGAIFSSILLTLCVPTILKAQNCKRANVLFILVDDLGKEWIQQYGAENIQLPNLQRLSQQSTLFERAYSMPQSTPSRMALLTGQYPYNNGWVNHYDVPRWGYGANYDFKKNPCFPKLVQENGYKTCVAGKWQLNDFRLQPDAMNLAGFDEYCMWTGGEGGNEEISESRYWDPYIHTKDGSKQYKGKFGPDIYSDFIIDFMKKNKDKPMFIYYPMTLTHTPFVTTPHNLNAKTPYQKHRAMVEYTDYIIGKLLDAVKNNNLQDNTYIIFATDNGTSGTCVGKRDGHYIRGGKTLLSENGINCPFIVHSPGQNKKTVSDALIDFTDIYPTVLELTGTKNDSQFSIDGHSFVSILRGNAISNSKKYALSMGSLPARIDANGMVKNQYPFRDRVIIGEKYKIYLTTEREINRIYDIVKDPYEANNLVSDNKILDEVNKNMGEIIKALPLKDENPKYTPLPHNKAFDFDLNAMNEKMNNNSKKKRDNFAPLSNKDDYNRFINNVKTKNK